MRVATDVGGTFTDLVHVDEDGIHVSKAGTTPPNFERGLLSALDAAGLRGSEVEFFAHGTTVVINALLSRRGACTALVTTAGFRDVLEIGRGNRPDLFNFAFRKPSPFVPRSRRFEVSERIDYRGNVVLPLEEKSLEGLLEELDQVDADAVAICFLHAYVNPEHEARVESFLRQRRPDLSVVSSHSVCREWREYERTSTAVLSAYVHPLAKSYLASLSTELRAREVRSELLVMQSNGGVATLQGTLNNPISMVESGPASGVLAAAELGRQLGEGNVIALDIGGTTAKTALIGDGKVRISSDYRIEWDRTNPGYPIRIPVVDLVEIGNGGGSIAWIDEGGSLHVGPVSAGALPGPAAYGMGGLEPTATDANLLLGRINPDLFLGGARKPDMEGVERAFAGLMKRLGGSLTDVARGVVRIANANMVNALKLVSLNRGHDTRDFSLVAFGGGGGIHAAALADELMIPRVIIPAHSSVFSAWGMLMSDLRRDFVRTQVEDLSDGSVQSVADTFARMEAEALRQCLSEGMPAERSEASRFADLRYKGQEHTVKVAFPARTVDEGALLEAIDRFHAAHEQEFTYRLANPVELVNFHIVVTARVGRSGLPRLPRGGIDPDIALTGVRIVDFDEAGEAETRCYDLSGFGPGMRILGPAVVEDGTAAVLVPPGRRAEMDDFGNIHIEMYTP
jgi:N-methylhydantoinase A